MEFYPVTYPTVRIHKKKTDDSKNIINVEAFSTVYGADLQFRRVTFYAACRNIFKN